MFQSITILLNIQFLANAYPAQKSDPKLTLIEYDDYLTSHDDHGSGAYHFNYDITDPENHNIQTRTEERLANGTVIGSYGYVRPDGMVQFVSYVADENGYR